VLVPGEDLTPYRKTSASIFTVLTEFGSATQKLGMDEVCCSIACVHGHARRIAGWQPRRCACVRVRACVRACVRMCSIVAVRRGNPMPAVQVFVDVTIQCKEMLRQYRSGAAGRAAAGSAGDSSTDMPLRWCGHVHRSKHAVHSETRHRPMDLRVNDEQPVSKERGPGHGEEGDAQVARAASDQDLLLMVRSASPFAALLPGLLVSCCKIAPRHSHQHCSIANSRTPDDAHAALLLIVCVRARLAHRDRREA